MTEPTAAPLSVVTWRWKPAVGYRSTFPVESVNTLKRMVARHYRGDHVFRCVTDDPRGLDSDIDVVPLWKELADVASPHGPKKPSCYRRLKAFDASIGPVLGERFVSLDLDVVLTGDVTPLWRRPESFVIYGDTNPRTPYNGSMFLLTAGARRQVWEQFDARTSPQRSKAAGFCGSDQGWISLCLGAGESKWNQGDGVYSFRNHIQPRGGTLPPSARLVVFHGRANPWDVEMQQRYPFIREHYR